MEDSYFVLRDQADSASPWIIVLFNAFQMTKFNIIIIMSPFRKLKKQCRQSVFLCQSIGRCWFLSNIYQTGQNIWGLGWGQTCARLIEIIGTSFSSHILAILLARLSRNHFNPGFHHSGFSSSSSSTSSSFLSFGQCSSFSSPSYRYPHLFMLHFSSSSLSWSEVFTVQSTKKITWSPSMRVTLWPDGAAAYNP